MILWILSTDSTSLLGCMDLQPRIAGPVIGIRVCLIFDPAQTTIKYRC